MKIIKLILRIPLYLIHYSLVFLIVVIGEWICNKDLTLKQSMKEFFEVKMFN